MMRAKKSSAAVALTLGLVLLYGATCVRITLNGTQSLPHNAYAMVVWPKIVWRGAYGAFEPPKTYHDTFSGLVFVKKIVGRAGDVVQHRDGKVCIAEDCFAPFMMDGAAFDAPLAEGTIGSSQYAAFAQAPDSLDSRYASVGLFHRNDLKAVGVPLPFPHWKELSVWISD